MPNPAAVLRGTPPEWPAGRPEDVGVTPICTIWPWPSAAGASCAARDDGPTLRQLRGLRALFPAFGHRPPNVVLDHLRAGPICVVPIPERAAPDALVRSVMALNIGVELIQDNEYPAYVRALLPPPAASWPSAHTRAEFVFRPSFGPEVIVRFWTARIRTEKIRTGRTNARVQVTSLNRNIWASFFAPSAWLFRCAATAAIERPPETRTDSVAAIGTLAPVVSAANILAGLPPRPGPPDDGRLDGMPVEFHLRVGHHERTHTFHSPRPDQNPSAFALLTSALTIASEPMHEPDARLRLEELRRAGLGIAR